MKGKTRQQKGITLIALIITIVVLLILAVVTIGAIKNDSIISYADNSTEQYKEGQTKEEGILEYYEGYLAGERVPIGTWTQKGATLTKMNADGTKTQIKIGDYVNYVEGSYTHTPDNTKGVGISKSGGSYTNGYTLATTQLNTEENLTWRVLGVNEKGQIELISADVTAQTLCLANDTAYLNAVTKDGQLGTLDKFCNDLYGKGENNLEQKVAEGARSLTSEDINKLTNYIPATPVKYICRYPTTTEVSGTRRMQVSVDGGENWTNLWYRDGQVHDGSFEQYQTIRLPGGTKTISSSKTGSIEIEINSYNYTIANELTTEDGYTEEEILEISNMITKGTGSSNVKYWLASCCTSWVYYASFGVCSISGGKMGFTGTYRSYIEYYYTVNQGVRPVVTLSSNATLTGSGSDIGSETNMWQITLK